MFLPDNTLLQGGKYKIIRFIASGGFGCTYEAEHVMLGKRVAIKEFFVKDFCNRDLATYFVSVGAQSKVALVSKLKKKFLEEASAISQFNHPNIVHVSDVFEENGTAYYVMNYINGRSIQEILKTQSTLQESKAIKYITQVAEALKQVHAQNRLHLDIKPGNIIIDLNDNAILIDFGASKQYDEVEGENTSTLIGHTPGYAPLEQLGNDIVKFMPATDIYALGATLYKMLTGKTPLSATMLASGDELAPLPSHITESTRNAIMASMSTNKNLRPQSIQAFLLKLSEKPTVNSSDTQSMEEEDTLCGNENVSESAVSDNNTNNNINTEIQEQGSDEAVTNSIKIGKSITKSFIIYGCVYLLVSIAFYIFWFGSDSNFSEGEPMNIWGTLYMVGGIVIFILTALFLSVRLAIKYRRILRRFDIENKSVKFLRYFISFAWIFVSASIVFILLSLK